MLALAVFLLLLTQTTAGVSKPDSWRTRDRGGCIVREREALLSIKAGTTADQDGLLSSWRGLDCCRWEGVRCSNITGHVIELDLHAGDNQYLGGEISPSLKDLEHLQHLDLSGNLLTGPRGRLPDFLGSLSDLRYLNLSGMIFSGTVPHQLGNLSRLQYLHLGSDGLHSKDLSWLSQLSLLKHLHMNVNLSTVIGWVDTVNMLGSLEVLRLPGCSLIATDHYVPRSNLTRLKILDLSFNFIEMQFNAINWLWDATSLKYLNLEHTGVYGMFPARLGNLSSLEALHLSGNLLKGMIPDTLCSLRTFELAQSDVQGDVMEFIKRLPKCSWSQLRVLRLGHNNITGSLSGWIKHMTSLSILDLNSNRLTGPLTIGIAMLSNLIHLNLAYNQMDGLITQDHFSKLTELQELRLSANNFTMGLNSDWIPPFRLQLLGLKSCCLGPEFPRWLESQKNISFLYMSGAGIVDTMPDWFWTVFTEAQILDLSSNNIRGTLPATLGQMKAVVLDLSSNQFNGSVPQLPQDIIWLDLSRNFLSGPLPLNSSVVESLFLSDNHFTGTIPESLCQMKSLTLLDIGSNMITGQFPRCSENVASRSGMLPPNTSSPDSDSSSSMPLSMSIEILRLDNNSLSDEFPLLLQNCLELSFIDLGQNNFFGSIPAWVGQKLPQLQYLSLRSNMFSGYIPGQLRGLRYLQFLDLAHNNFSGTIPRSLLNMDGSTKTTEISTPGKPSGTSRGMVVEDVSQDVSLFNFDIIKSIFAVTKGQGREYIGRSIYMVSLDLSCNHLTGDIPKSIGPAVGLVSMNLSMNYLTGKIPENIGSMHSLESLDLSSNQLCGEIPSSLSNLTSLSYLNLSYNELSGRIPSGPQLNTLNPDNPASMYIGNPGLCGPPLKNSCPGNHTTESHFTASKDGSETMPFFFGLSVGVVVGLWVVFCSLLFKKTWRASYFRLFDEVCDKMYVLVVVKWSRMTRKATTVD